MKVTITEALRIHKEVAAIVTNLMRKSGQVRYGTTKEDGVEISANENQTFPEYVQELKRIFLISEALNSTLAEVNVRLKISDKVRTRENFKALLRTYENALLYQSPKNSTRFEIVGDKKNKVNVTFEAFMSKANIKKEIKSVKAQIRDLQSDIDGANSMMIDLPFEYADIEVEGGESEE